MRGEHLSQLQQALGLHRQGDLHGALALYEKILGDNPRHADALHLTGRAKMDLGKPEDAVKYIQRALSVCSQPGYMLSLADCLRRTGELEKAEAHCQAVIQIDQQNPEAWYLLGAIRRAAGCLSQAEHAYRKALELRPVYPETMNNLAAVLHFLGKNTEAESYARHALALQPENPLVLNNLGLSLRGQGRLDEAREAFQAAALQFYPARFNLGHLLLMRGDLRNGLPLFETRKKVLGIGKNMTMPEWDGTDVTDQRLLIIAEQGLGDMILMCRFLPKVAKKVGKAILQVQGPLRRLMQVNYPGIDLVDLDETVEHDCWCSIMSLPSLIGLNSVNLIPNQPWLDAEPAILPGDGVLKIGLNWAGNPTYPYDAARSTNLEELSLLLQIPGVDWFSLHKGCREDEATKHHLAQPLQDAADFLDTARVIKGLDLVVSTETAVPNLSAAMGVPTAVLANPDLDWRWEYWYGHVVICQHHQSGLWMESVIQVMQLIQMMLEEKSAQAKAMAESINQQ